MSCQSSQNVRNTPGAASWSPLHAPVAYLDTFSPTPTALWSTHRVVSTFTGTACNISGSPPGNCSIGLWNVATSTLPQESVSGTCIPSNTTVVSVNTAGQSFVMSNNATGSCQPTIATTQASFYSQQTAWNNWLASNCGSLVQPAGGCVPANDNDLYGVGASQTSVSATTTSGSATVTLGSIPSGVQVGATVTGTGIKGVGQTTTPTTVTAVNPAASQITISQAANATGSTTLTFLCNFNPDDTHPSGPTDILGSTCGGYGRWATDIYTVVAPFDRLGGPFR